MSKLQTGFSTQFSHAVEEEMTLLKKWKVLRKKKAINQNEFVKNAIRAEVEQAEKDGMVLEK